MMKIFTNNLGAPEGPVLLPDESFLFVEMNLDRGCVTHVSNDGTSKRVLAKTGRPNGLARDKDGFIWVAETLVPSLLKMTMEGDYQIFAKEYKGEGFLYPNDLAFAPNGDIYLTDSGILLETIAPGGEFNPDFRNLDYDGRVYRIDPETGEVERIDNGIIFTNGIAFGPDGNLYVNESMTGNIFRYEYEDNKVIGERELFGNVIEHFKPEELKAPDGMKFDADGNLYVCVFGQGDVTVLDKDGEVTNRIKTDGSMPTNLCFAKEGEKKIYVTEVETGTVQVFDVETGGFPLYM